MMAFIISYKNQQILAVSANFPTDFCNKTSSPSPDGEGVRGVR